jgi:very-long-chain enoyl-CoA reductase
MGILHYAKRVIECISVHRYSKQTKSINRLIWDMAYTWLFFGIGVGYYLFHPLYKAPFWEHYNDERNILYYILFSVFILCEAINLMCHLHLKSLRKKQGDFNLGIPTLHGFSHVSCANYFWEFGAWAIFTLVTQSLMSFMFFCVSFFRMNYKA